MIGQLGEGAVRAADRLGLEDVTRMILLGTWLGFLGHVMGSGVGAGVGPGTGVRVMTVGLFITGGVGLSSRKGGKNESEDDFELHVAWFGMLGYVWLGYV